MKDLKTLVETTNVLSEAAMTQIKGGGQDIRSQQTTTVATTGFKLKP